MKTLYELALAAVPNPGFMAEKYLLPHHPAARDLEARQFQEDRARWQKEHKLKFRCVVCDLHIIESIFEALCPSNVQTFNRILKDVNDLYHSLFSK